MNRTILKRAIFSVSLAAVASLAIADTTHVVQKGETLYSLSRTYGTTVQAICEANGIADGSSVKAGQKLVIPDGSVAAETKTTASATAKTDAPKSETKTTSPAPVAKSADGTYTVQKGDTWYGIARTYGTNVNELYALNNADSATTLKFGQKIKVPDASGKSSAVASASGSKTTAPVPTIEDPRSYSGKKGDSSLEWPVKSPAVTYIEGKISGVNLSAKKDEAVTAIRAGTVMFSGTYRGFGNVVFIQSKTGHIYAYTGLGTVKVNKGDYCVFGAQVGTVGVDSISQKPQMSLMVFQNGLPIDPAKAPRG